MPAVTRAMAKANQDISKDKKAAKTNLTPTPQLFTTAVVAESTLSIEWCCLDYVRAPRKNKEKAKNGSTTTLTEAGKASDA